VIDILRHESSPFAKLNLIESLGRLGVPGGRDALRPLVSSKDPGVIRLAVIRAASHSTPEQMMPFLERILAGGAPEETAEALQSTIRLGASGPELLAVARKAAAASNTRQSLIGLLALSIWAPDEAIGRIIRVLGAPPSARWFLAAYALRYVGSPRTVPLLRQLARGVRGTELEEIVVSSLGRHLEVPEALETLLSILKSQPSPTIAGRITTDLARHLPAERALEAGVVIREIVTSAALPAIASPLLAALGSLGTLDDTARLVAALAGEAAPGAIQGLDLLADPAAAGPLASLASGSCGPTSHAALGALFRLDAVRAVALLSRLIETGQDTVPAARCFVEMALSVRLAGAVSSLAHLYDALSRTAPGQPVPPARAKPDGDRPSPEAPRPDLDAVLSVTRKKAASSQAPRRSRPNRATDAAAALSKGAPAPGTDKGLYSDLASHMAGFWDESSGQIASGRILIGGLAVLICVGGVGLHLRSRVQGAKGEEVSRFSRFPPLYRGGVEPEDGAVKPGDAIIGSRDSPVTLFTRIRENSMTVRGRFVLDEISFTTAVPPAARLVGRLQMGQLLLKFPRGRARIAVEGARTNLEIINGAVELEMKDSTFLMSVRSGEVKVFRDTILMKTLSGGQGGEFLDGNPTGRIEEVSTAGP
jgi:hypothetical protein